MAFIVNVDNGQIVQAPDNAPIRRNVASKTGTGMGCELGQCTSCIIKIVKGKQHLNEPSERELQTLANACAPENARLFCQMRIAEEQTIEVQKFNRETDRVPRSNPAEKSETLSDNGDDPFADLCAPESTSLIRREVVRNGVEARQ